MEAHTPSGPWYRATSQSDLRAARFRKAGLAESLCTNGYRSEAPSLFSWLGVTYYLTADAIFSTLRTVASMAAGTEIIFEYGLPLSMLDEQARQGITAIMAQAASRGEPMVSFFESASLAAQVREVGFAEVWDFGPKEANARYFADRSDGSGFRPRVDCISWARESGRQAEFLEQRAVRPCACP